MAASDTTMIMVNGIPGAMAVGCAEVALIRGLSLCPIALAGSSSGPVELKFDGSMHKSVNSGIPQPTTVELYPKDRHGEGMEAALKLVDGDRYRLLVVDYTAPQALASNVVLYSKYGVSFVSGTTGFSGDMNELYATVEKGDGCYAVIAPNMNKQIVAFQWMVGQAASTFPGCFSGYELSIKETHQKTKKDISGTAKALCGHMSQLANDPGFTEEKIEDVRDDERAMKEMGVPEEFLAGHAFHTYTFQRSQDVFRFQHNICGRRSYCEGTLDALEWLLKGPIQRKHPKQVWNMIDVLKGEAAM